MTKAKENANAFIGAARKSKQEMDGFMKRPTKKEEAEKRGLKIINIRIPADLHKKMQYHRIETGESMTALMVRLLEDELR